MDFEEEVKKYFKDILECPVCFETINSVPIYQCRNGHVVCKNCHPKLETCPICRELRDGSIRNLKLEEMVERLQLSDSEVTKKLTSESIQIDSIVPKTQNVWRDTNQETKQATVQLSIVEDDENVTSETFCALCCKVFKWLIIVIFCFIMFYAYMFASVYLLSLGTPASVIFGIYLAIPPAVIMLILIILRVMM